MYRCQLWTLWLLLSSVLLSGLSCSRSGDMIPVQGKVLHKGQPVSGATVKFLPANRTEEDADWPLGTTDQDGSFELKTGDTYGAPPGSYKVTIVCLEAPQTAPKGMAMSSFETEDRFKGAYANADKSTISVEVKSGMSPLEPFDLK